MRFTYTFALLAIATYITPALSLPTAGSQALAARDGIQARDDAKERTEQIGEDIDDLLDEIDDVLEENAEEFVRGFVQKGGN
jgi:ubiquitin-like protein Pup